MMARPTVPHQKNLKFWTPATTFENTVMDFKLGEVIEIWLN